MVKVGIVGGTGYTGAELLRLLVGHPNANVTVITSRSEKGVPVAQLYPNLEALLTWPSQSQTSTACRAVIWCFLLRPMVSHKTPSLLF